MPNLSLPAALAALALAAPGAAQNVLYSTDFSDAQGWTLVNSAPSGSSGAAWGVDALPATTIVPYTSAPASLNFNHNVLGLPWGVWSGTATSPVIDLSAGIAPARLQFNYGFVHEVDCQWDAFSVQVIDAVDPFLVHFADCLSMDSFALSQWRQYDLPLNRAWGQVRVRFVHDTIDDWNFGEQGSFVDDVMVVEDCGATVHCEGLPQSTGAPGADLAAVGSASISTNDLRLIGSGFPLHTFAAAFAGPDSATIPIGAGVRCIGVGSSVRLAVAPTRDQGAPLWSLDLQGFPLLQLAVAGQPLYVQTIFRDGATFNLSDALRIDLCP
ncbi:MAG: hypothetical protein R3F49_23265 [Planctomycetota bacterium]